jgi:putative ABC transport system substrate-binding protein
VSVIFAMDLPSAFAAKAATKSIPIVFVTGADPVKVDLVETFSRPNGNLTGMSISFSVPGPKRVELLHELLPAANTIALLGNPGNANFQPDAPDIGAAADAPGANSLLHWRPAMRCPRCIHPGCLPISVA